MSRTTMRQMILGSVATVALIIVGTTIACSRPEKTSSIVEILLPAQLMKEDIQAFKDNDSSFTKLEFAGSTFCVRTLNIGHGVAFTVIGIYAPDEQGVHHRILSAESWAAGYIVATVDVETGILELRERANSELNGQLVLSCNLKTVGTQHSIRAK